MTRFPSTIAAVLFAALLLSAPPTLGAQHAGPAWRPGAWLGMAWETRTILGGMTDRELFVAALQVARSVAASDRLALDYVAGAVPLAVVAAPAAPRTRWPACPRERICLAGSAVWSEWDKSYGVGLIPLGAQVSARVVGSLAMQVGLHAGALWFSDDTPVEQAGRLQWLASTGAGLGIDLPIVGRLSAGYRLLHLSNAGLAPQNPGLNADLWYLGWSR